MTVLALKLVLAPGFIVVTSLVSRRFGVALAGRTQDAIEHLRQAVEGSERFRELAREDSDFDSLRDEPAFKQLVG